MKGARKKTPAKDETKKGGARLAGGAKPLTGGGGIFKSAAVAVLRMERRLMTTGEITKTALKKGLVKCQGKTPDATMASALYTDIKRKLDQSVFTRPQEGLFGLREWIEEGFFPDGWEGPADGLGVAPFKKRSNQTWTPASGKVQPAPKRIGRSRAKESYVVPDDEVDDEETADEETEEDEVEVPDDVDDEMTEEEEEQRPRRGKRKMPWLKSGTRGRRPSAKMRSSAELLVEQLMSNAAEIGTNSAAHGDSPMDFSKVSMDLNISGLQGSNGGAPPGGEGGSNGQALDWDLAVAAAQAVGNAGGGEKQRLVSASSLQIPEPSASNGNAGLDSSRMRRRPKLLVDVNSTQPDADQPNTFGLLSLGLSTPSLFQGLDTPLLMPDSVTGLGGPNMFAQPSPRLAPSPRLPRASTASPGLPASRALQPAAQGQGQRHLKSPREGSHQGSLPHIPELNLSLNIHSLPSPGPTGMDQLNTPAMMALPLPDALPLSTGMEPGGQNTSRGGGQMNSIFSPSGLLSGFTPRFSDFLHTSKAGGGLRVSGTGIFEAGGGLRVSGTGIFKTGGGLRVSGTGIFKAGGGLRVSGTGIFKGDGVHEGPYHSGAAAGSMPRIPSRGMLESPRMKVEDAPTQAQQMMKYARAKLAEAERVQDVVTSLETRLGQSHPTVGKAWLTLSRMFHHLSDALPTCRDRAAAALGRAVEIGKRCAEQHNTAMECYDSVAYLRGVMGGSQNAGMQHRQTEPSREKTPV
eukprot:gene13473-19333_t